jgi:RimJ/RimL family protein N-acetyltransferase
MTIEIIRLVDELAANAWAAHTNQIVSGWRLRWNDGVTGRANSVWAGSLGEDQITLEDRIQIAEEFYRRRNAPTKFHICPATQPAHLDSILESRGYVVITPTDVQIAPVDSVLELSASNYEASVSENFTEVWLDAFCKLSEQTDTRAIHARREILRHIAPRAGYALLKIDDRDAAVGLGVVERGWIGLFSIDTGAAFRKRGAATAIIRALLKWGQTFGATQTYLQVVPQNTPAIRLYAKLGFKKLYQYHYRELAS